MEEENYSEKSETSSKTSNLLTVKHTTENTLQFKYDLKTINRIEERRGSEITYKLNLEQRETDTDSLLAFCPIEVYERNFLRNLQQKQQERESDYDTLALPTSSTSAFSSLHCGRRDDNTMVSNSLQIPIISLAAMERPPLSSATAIDATTTSSTMVVENVYTSDNMTIIDTDVTVPQV